MKGVASLLLVTLVACQQATPTIYVTSYPIEYITRRIVDDELLVKNVSVGTFAPRATFDKTLLKEMKNSDVLFRNGQLESYLDLYTDSIEGIGVQIVDLDASSSITAQNRYQDTTDNTSVLLKDDNSFKVVDQYRNIPYPWLDPMVLKSMARTIVDHLSQLIPEKASLFMEQYDALQLDLISLDAQYQKLNNTSQTIKIASITPAFSAWSQPFAIEHYPLVMSRFGVAPSNTQYQQILDRIVSEEVHYFAAEANMPSDLLSLSAQLVNDANLISIQLHNIFALSESDKANGKDYLSIMQSNLQTLLAIREQ